MIAAILAAQVATAAMPTPAIGPIGPQRLPASGCAAFLWSTAGDRPLVAMAVANPAHLRLAVDGAAAVDLPLAEGQGAGALGFSPDASYRGDGLLATLTMTVTPRADLGHGALVSAAVLTVTRPGGDSVALPVAGLVGCAASYPG